MRSDAWPGITASVSVSSKLLENPLRGCQESAQNMLDILIGAPAHCTILRNRQDGEDSLVASALWLNRRYEDESVLLIRSACSSRLQTVLHCR